MRVQQSAIGTLAIEKNESDVALFQDCQSARTDAAAGPIYTKYQNKRVTVAGVEVTDLTCLGAGGFGLVFAGMTTRGLNVIVKFFFTAGRGRVDTRAFKWAEFIQAQVKKNPGATGASYFMKAVTDAQVADDLYAQVWSRAYGFNLAQIEGPLHMNANYDLIGSGHNRSIYGFNNFFKQGASDTYNRKAFLTVLQKTMEGVLFLWRIGLEHGDIQRSNIMWDSEQLTFIDYDTMRFYNGGKNADVADAVRISQNWRAPKGKKAQIMQETFEADEEIGSSFEKFQAFVEHFTESKVVLAAEPTNSELEALARELDA